MSWSEYLEARMQLIDEFDREGKTVEEIYQILLVDPGQIRLLVMTARERREAKGTP